eukprot:1377719-Karenia_brevis.AAC.1
MAVRRWRLARVGEALPGLIPELPDVGHCSSNLRTTLVDFSAEIATLVRRKGHAARKSDGWDPAWAPSLVSAICGGQWTQNRKAQ